MPIIFVFAFLFLMMAWEATTGAAETGDYTGVGAVMFLVGGLFFIGNLISLFAEERRVDPTMYASTETVLKRLLVSAFVAAIGMVVMA